MSTPQWPKTVGYIYRSCSSLILSENEMFVGTLDIDKMREAELTGRAYWSTKKRDLQEIKAEVTAVFCDG